MRIKSHFKDYYDGLTSHNGPLYIRETSKKEITSSLSFKSREVGPRGKTIQYHPILVGFCGKIYPAFIRYFRIPNTIKTGIFAYYSIEDMLKHHNNEWAEKDFSKNDILKFTDSNPKYSHTERVTFNLRVERAEEFQQYFSPTSPCFIVKEGNSGYFSSDDRILELNPNLRSYEFYKLFDTVSAFQELEMYLGGLASPEKPIPYISDKDMIEAKGFDGRYSFRKDASKCKR